MPPAPPINIEILPEDYVDIYRVQGDSAELPPIPLANSPSSPMPSISSVPSSSAHSSASSTSFLSSGMISVRSLDAALQLTTSMANLSVGERCSPIRRSASLRGLRQYTLTPAPVGPSVGARRSSPNLNTLTRGRVARRNKGDPIFIVVRGERPGVYLDHEIALTAGGCSPAMKIVHFYSLKYACFYFVAEYMSGKVGVPQFVVTSLEAADESDRE
ncbi:hypothetical protein V8D89_012140 [Ganoderma adspersum]